MNFNVGDVVIIKPRNQWTIDRNNYVSSMDENIGDVFKVKYFRGYGGNKYVVYNGWEWNYDWLKLYKRTIII